MRGASGDHHLATDAFKAKIFDYLLFHEGCWVCWRCQKYCSFTVVCNAGTDCFLCDKPMQQLRGDIACRA